MNNWIISGVVFTLIGMIFTVIGYVKQLKDAENDKIELNNYRSQSLSNDKVIIGHSQLNIEKTDFVYKEVIDSRDVFDKNFKESNDYNIKKLKAESPYIEILSNDFQFRHVNDGTKYNIVFTNTKQRDAVNFEYEFFIVFKNTETTDWGDYYNEKSANNKINRIIKDHPIGTSGEIALPYETFIKVANGGLIQMKVKFYDEILNEYFKYKLNYKIKVENNNVIVFLGDKSSEDKIEAFMKVVNYNSKLN